MQGLISSNVPDPATGKRNIGISDIAKLAVAIADKTLRQIENTEKKNPQINQRENGSVK